MSHKFPDYEFLPYKDIVIEESKKLRSQGANIVLILSHVGNNCVMDFIYHERIVKSSKQ